MNNRNRIVAIEPTITAIDYSLFIAVVAIIAIAALDAAGGSVSHIFTIAADALTAAIST